MMEGTNQYSCEKCGTKVDALKGLEYQKLPDVMTISLMRFDFNYQTFERMKINDFYKFDLRLNMGKFTGNEDELYDLCGIVVHRGDAYAGHYHAIIRDCLDEKVKVPDQLAAAGPKKEDLLLETPEIVTKRKWIDDAKPVSANEKALMDVVIILTRNYLTDRRVNLMIKTVFLWMAIKKKTRRISRINRKRKMRRQEKRL